MAPRDFAIVLRELPPSLTPGKSESMNVSGWSGMAELLALRGRRLEGGRENVYLGGHKAASWITVEKGRGFYKDRLLQRKMPPMCSISDVLH